MDEQQAMGRLKQGDIEALAYFVLRYHLKAVRTAYLITRERSLAEDIVQTAFIHAYETIGRSNVRAFGPWFLRSVVNAAFKTTARRKREQSIEMPFEGSELPLADILPSLNPGPETLAEWAELREMLWQALGRLPPAQRAAVVQRYYLGVSESEMADSQECSQGTIKSRLHAARQGLRRFLWAWFAKLVPLAE